MANYPVSNIDQILSSQAQKEVTANENFDAASPAMGFGRQASTTVRLTFGYYGATVIVGGVLTQIPNGTLALTASATNYIKLTAAGAVNFTTSAPSGWPSALASGAIALWEVVTSGISITDAIDWRTAQGPGLPGAPGPPLSATGTGFIHVTSAVADSAAVSLHYQLEFLIGDGVNVITTGAYPRAAVYIPRKGTLTGWTVLSCDAATPTAGAISLDLWKDVYANYPPAVGDSMCGAGTKPNIAATNSKGQGSTFTSWTTTALAAGDVLFVNVDSVTALKSVKLILSYDYNGD